MSLEINIFLVYKQPSAHITRRKPSHTSPSLFKAIGESRAGLGMESRWSGVFALGV